MKIKILIGAIIAVFLLGACSNQNIDGGNNGTKPESVSSIDAREAAEKMHETKSKSYMDYYNEALDEEYWANIPDTPGDEFTYYKLNSEFLTHYNTSYTTGIAIESYIGNRTTVKIPEEIDGHPVLSITQNCLQGDGFEEPTIREIYIPDSIIDFWNLGYNNFEKIRTPQTAATGTDSISYYFALPKVKALALYGNKNIRFFNCDYNSLEELYFADGIEEIECSGKVFDGSSLKAVGIPSSVTKIYEEGGWGELENGKMGLLKNEVNIFGDRDVTIICEKGSYAQEYAEKYGLKTFFVE